VVNNDTDSVVNPLQLARNAVAPDQLDELEDELVAKSSYPPSMLAQLELEGIVKIAEAPRIRRERARAGAILEKPVGITSTSEDGVALPTVNELDSYHRAMSGAKNAQWRLGTRAKIDSQISNGTWDLMAHARHCEHVEIQD
jgi:hypothetical protein